MTSTIRVEGIQLYAYHGCFEEEQKIGQIYIVDVILEADLSRACETDMLTDTIDYARVYEIVKKQSETSSKLIEHFASRIKKALYEEFPQLKGLFVKVI